MAPTWRLVAFESLRAAQRDTVVSHTRPFTHLRPFFGQQVLQRLDEEQTEGALWRGRHLEDRHKEREAQGVQVSPSVIIVFRYVLDWQLDSPQQPAGPARQNSWASSPVCHKTRYRVPSACTPPLVSAEKETWRGCRPLTANCPGTFPELTTTPVIKVMASGRILSTSFLQRVATLGGPGRRSHRVSMPSITFF